jgi:hypothetical protein
VRGLICSSLLALAACGDSETVKCASVEFDDRGALRDCVEADGGTSGSDTGTEPAGCFASDATIDVGTGSAGFEVLEQDDPVVMVHGPQGGWHLLGSVRTHNMTDVVRIRFEVVVAESGFVVADNSLYVQTLPDGDCTGVYPGMYAYLVVDGLADGEADTPPELLAYEPLLFRAYVEDQEGRSATAEIRITATPDPVDLEDDSDTASPGR